MEAVLKMVACFTRDPCPCVHPCLCLYVPVGTLQTLVTLYSITLTVYHVSRPRMGFRLDVLSILFESQLNMLISLTRRKDCVQN